MLSIRPALVGLLLTLGLALTPAVAGAEGSGPAPTSEASDLADRGFKLFKGGDYAEAVALFQQAEAMSHSLVIVSYIAQSYEKLGRLVEAQQTYARIVNEPLGANEPEDFLKAQQLARRQAPLLQRRVPRLRLRISGLNAEQVTVALDGRELGAAQLDKPVYVNPGVRTLVLRVQGRAPLQRQFTAIERQVSDVQVVFVERAPGAGDGQRWIAPAVAFSVGSAGVAVGAVGTVLYFTRKDALDERCPADDCPELDPERDTVAILGVVSLVGWSLGLLGAGIGTTLLITGGSDEPATDGPSTAVRPALELRAGLGPGSVWLQGRF